jgi:hypothetical protein
VGEKILESKKGGKMEMRDKFSVTLKIILSIMLFYFARQLFISGQAVWGLAFSVSLSIIPYFFKNSTNTYRLLIAAGLLYLSQICLWNGEKLIGTIVMFLIGLAFELGVRIFHRERPNSDNHSND